MSEDERASGHQGRAKASGGEWTPTFCRLCEACCGLEARVVDGEVTALRPDAAHVASRGYACAKGLRAHERNASSDRLLTPRMRIAGRLEEVSWERALRRSLRITPPSLMGRRRRRVRPMTSGPPESGAGLRGRGRGLILPALLRAGAHAPRAASDPDARTRRGPPGERWRQASGPSARRTDWPFVTGPSRFARPARSPVVPAPRSP